MGEVSSQTGEAVEELLERTAELAALEAALTEARGGEGALLIALAEGGLGKSRLVVEGRQRAWRAGMRVLRARGDDLEHDFPFGIALQLFEGELRGASEAERAELLGGAAAPAADLVAPAVATRPADRPQEEHALIHALYWLTVNLADRGPLALLVDDAHWADAPSLRLLNYLAQRLGGHGVLLVVAGRPAEPGGEGELLDRLSAVPGARVLRPQPLSGGAVVALLAEWLGAQPDPAFAQACVEVTGGNPLLLRELVSALHEEGVAPTAATAQRVREVGPAPVSRSLALTLARLGPVATAVARAVAVLGEGAEYAQVAALARVGLDEAVGAAGELSRAGVLARGPHAAFAHPVLRQAVHEELDPGERSLAHHRAARIVADAGMPPERVAAHLRASRPAGDPWAVEALVAAARVVKGRGAPATAVGFLRRAIEEPPPLDARAGLVLELGQAEAAAGLPEAAERLREAVALLDDPPAQADALRSLGRTLFYLGRDEEAADAFEQALSAATGDGDLSLELAADFAQAASWHPQLRPRALRRLTPLLAGHRVAATTAERLALAHVAGDRFLKGHDREHVVALALRAWDHGAILRAGGDAEMAVFGLTGTLAHSDAFAEVEEVIEAALADARARGAAHAFATMTYRRAWLFRHLGRLDDAIADLERVIEARHEGRDVQLADAFGLLCDCHLQRGDQSAAADALALERRAEDRWPLSTAYALFREARGGLALARGDARRALEDFEAAGKLLVEEMDAPNPSLSAWRNGAALASMALDDVEAARARASEAVELARAFGAPRALGGALRVLGLVESGEPGLTRLEEAVGTLKDSPAEIERALAQVDLGAALRRSGRRADARTPLREGLDRADRAGAGSLAARARGELASAGARPRRARLSGPDALTPTERRVASMAASGMTNREIAQALFVTIKAVQWHLGNAYPKLGVSGREELPEALGQGSEA